MIKSVIKKLLKLKQRNLKIILAKDIEDNNGIDLTCLHDQTEKINNLPEIKYRRKISRIDDATAYHSQWLNDQQALIKSPFSEKMIKPVACYIPYIDTYHCIVYEYLDQQSFYLIVGDYWYEKLALYIPRQNQLIIKRESIIDIKEMLSLFPLYKYRSKKSNQKQTAIVLYHDHLAHHILNEINAIDALITNNLINKIDQIYYCDKPIGELESIFPEVKKGKFTKVKREELNQKSLPGNPLVLPYQTATISDSTIRRFKDYTNRRSTSKLNSEIKKTKSQYDICIWVSIRSDNRILENQIQLLSALYEAITSKGKTVTYLIDGYSKPYKLSIREGNNYERAIIEEKKIAVQLTERGIPYIDLIGKPITEVLQWTSIADTYFCHSGTLHHKISWFANIPGIIHSNEHHSRLPEALLPGMTEKEWKYKPLRIPVASIKDTLSESFGREGNLLPQKFNNYVADVESVVDLICKILNLINLTE